MLVASPELTDPNFSRAVVIILGSNDSGAIGVIVNRPTTLSPAKTFPDLAANFTGYDGTLYRGGPVGPTRLLFLVRGLAAATVQGPEVVDKVFLSSDAEALPDIMRLADGVNDLRVFAGHAEWSPGQLEREIAAGAWTTVPGTDELLFAADPGNLWNALIHRGDGVVADAGSAR